MISVTVRAAGARWAGFNADTVDLLGSLRILVCNVYSDWCKRKKKQKHPVSIGSVGGNAFFFCRKMARLVTYTI